MRLPPLVHGFDERLWTASWRRRRSRECTPLYIERYRGPRSGNRLLSHQWWEITCTLGGQGVLTGQRDYRLQPGIVCLIPPGYRHDERAEGDLETIWIGFIAQGIPLLKTPGVICNERVRHGCEELWLLAQRRGDPVGPELDAGVATLVAQCLRLRMSVGPADATLMERAVRHLDEHFAEPIFVEELARRFGCSAGYFHRQFKCHTGLTPTIYVTQLRIQQARRLLELTNMRVAEVAQAVGYDDPFYFSRVYRKLTGQAPSTRR